MRGWIIYSGTLKIKKIEDLVESFIIEGKKLNIKMEKIKNTELLPIYNNEGKPDLIFLKKVKNPDFIIFWDKDIFLAKHLENMGYRLFNSSRAIDYCDDKCLMHLSLSNKNISMPKTVISPMIFNSEHINEDYLIEVFNAFNKKVVIKEGKGSFGMQVYLIEEKEAFINKVKELNKKNVRFIIQEKIVSSFGKDIRVNIIGNKVVGAMLRKSNGDFRANISQGGIGEIINLSREQEEIALKAHKELGLDFSGVDLLLGENNKPLLCEVNSNLNFLSFEKLWGKSFAREILNYIIGELNA
ncbi:MAG: RimK family alpha-L-glutamate ligase [Clostridiales bacterium]|nr:RimK family alpha-L-glutamate ligase [Clostridiales bacterium]